MKALVIRQPWADLVVDGHKDVENRSWATKYRGPLLIVASKARHVDDERKAHDICLRLKLPTPKWPTDHGAIIGVVDLVEIHHPASIAPASPWREPGEMHWELARPRRFAHPIPCKGQLGLFDVDIADAIVAAAVEAHHLKGQTP